MTNIDEILVEILNEIYPADSWEQIGFSEAKAKFKILLNEARIDELTRIDTRRRYGADYQESLDETDDYKENRINELREGKDV
jgi:hypothetical protein